MTTSLSKFDREVLLGTALALLAGIAVSVVVFLVYRCLCGRYKNAKNSEELIGYTDDRDAGELVKLRRNSDAQNSNPIPAARKRDDIKQLRKHSVYTKHWLEVVRRQRISPVGLNQTPEVEFVRQNIQPEMTISSGRQMRVTSSDQNRRQSSLDTSRPVIAPLLEKALSEDAECYADDIFRDDEVIVDTCHGCQVQLLLSYSRSEESLIVKIVRLFGLNSLRDRNRWKETRASDVAAAAVMATDSVATDAVEAVSSFVQSTYIGLTVLPDRDKCLITTAKKNANVLIWNESFNFGGYRADQLSSRSLQLQVFTYDQFSRSEPIGYSILPLCHVDLSTTQTLFRSLVPGIFQGDKLGELLLSLCYQPTIGRVTVVIMKARQLATRDNKQSIDPYVKIWLLNNGKRVEKRKTSVKEKTTDPVYNESFVFSVPSDRLRMASLSFSIADRKTIGHNHAIGHVHLGSRSGPAEVKHWNEAMEKARQPVAQWHRLKEL